MNSFQLSRNKATSVFTRALLLSICSLLLLASFFENAYRSADFDPQQMRLYVERTIRFGGSFYENGLHNKGPLDPLIYRAAHFLGGHDSFWFAISSFIVLGTLLIGVASLRTSSEFGAPLPIGVAISIIAFFHFSLARTSYSGVLYSRNEVSYMLVGAWLLILSKRARRSWKMEKSTSVLLGVLLGLAVQTVLTAFFSALAIFGVWFFLTFEIKGLNLALKNAARVLIAALVAFISAPVWYLLRGQFGEFWGGWWIYARFQSDATGRSLANQFGWGWDNITQYYGDWPLSLAIVTSGVVLLFVYWSHLDFRQRTVYLGVIFWLVGGWVELILSQRYSTHYFVVVAVPTMILGSVVVSHAFHIFSLARPTLRVGAAPFVALCLSLVHFSNNSVRSGLESFSNYRGETYGQELVRNSEPGNVRTVRAILDLVSSDGDALLAWTGWPWRYLDLHRVSASRMIWSSMFLGEIYLASSGPQWVVPNTWEWFAEDMSESNPTAYIESKDFRRVEDIPFDKFVDQNFSLKYSGTLDELWLRNDLAKNLGKPRVDSVVTFPIFGEADVGGGFCSSHSFALVSKEGPPLARINIVDDLLKVTDRQFEISNEIVSSSGEGKVYDSSPAPEHAERYNVQVLIGNRSVVLVINGMIVGAHRLIGFNNPQISIESLYDELRVSSVTSEDIHWPAGCS